MLVTLALSEVFDLMHKKRICAEPFQLANAIRAHGTFHLWEGDCKRFVSAYFDSDSYAMNHVYVIDLYLSDISAAYSHAEVYYYTATAGPEETRAFLLFKRFAAYWDNGGDMLPKSLRPRVFERPRRQWKDIDRCPEHEAERLSAISVTRGLRAMLFEEDKDTSG